MSSDEIARQVTKILLVVHSIEIRSPLMDFGLSRRSLRPCRD